MLNKQREIAMPAKQIAVKVQRKSTILGSGPHDLGRENMSASSFAGPFNGQMFLLVVDAKSKWIEVFPMHSTTASTTIRALRFLFATHGLPEVIVSDNGPQFIAQEMKDFLKSNGIRHCLSSPYRPASNGEIERAVRTSKSQ